MSTVSRFSMCLAIALVSFAIVPGASALNSRGSGLAVSVATSAPVSGWFVFKPKDDRNRDRHHNRESVPEGGSTAAYLLLAGITCFGAIALQSRKRIA